MTETRFRGIIPALLTPFREDDTLDLDALGPLVERLVQQDVGGLFVCGSTGEWCAMTSDERRQVATTAIDTVQGRVPVMVHVGAFATREAVALAQHAEEIGAQAISALPPVGRPLPNDAVWEHFRTIGAACGLPLYLYHLPQVYGEQIKVDDFIGALDTMPTLAGVKFSSYYVRDLIALRMKAQGRLNIISGCSEQLLSTVANGADGSICTWYNVIPRLGHKVFTCVLDNDVAAASRYQELLVRYAVSVETNHMACLKHIVTRRGIDVGHPRRPLPRLTADEFDAVYPGIVATGIEEWFI